MNTRHTLWMGAIALGYGVTLAFGAGTASADDSTGSPAPAPSSAETTKVSSEDTPRISTGIKSGGTPITSLGNGRMMDFSSMSGIYSATSATSPTASATNEARAKELEASAKSMEANRNNDEEMIAQMQNMLDGVRSTLELMPVQERLSPRNIA